MYVIVWRFSPRPECVEAFESAYGPRGAWATLFARAPGFVAVELLRGADGGWLTLDRWESREDYDAFRTRFAADYQRLDAQMEHLTLREEAVGHFEAVG